MTTRSKPHLFRLLCQGRRSLGDQQEHIDHPEEAVLQGYGIIGGGATKTLGSVHALEAVAAENYRKHQDDRIIDIDPSIKPQLLALATVAETPA